MAPQTGLEPVTSWLTVMRSTDWAIEEHILATTYSPTKRICSTIGARGLNFCVRNGYRCDPSAIITRIFYSLWVHLSSLKTKQCIKYLFQFSNLLLGQALDLLVSVSSMNHFTYTPDLSTRSSLWSLTSLRNGKSHLKVCFALRCFQRLSFPDIATQLCLWRDNWCTSGLSNPVLSY